MNKEKITKIVHEVLKESGWATQTSQKPLAPRENKSKKGPAVLNVFHAGVRKLEAALEQVQLIEATARRSSVYTVESARDKVCGADVREKSGVRCILDTVKPDGLERILQKAEILVLPTFCLKTAAKVASLMCDDQESIIVFTALLQGKKVLAAQDGFMIYKSLVNDRLGEEIKQLLKKLEGFGMIFCPTDQLNATFQKIAASSGKTQAAAASKAADLRKEKPANAVKLITAKVINTAVDNKHDIVRLAPGGKVTPLGRDLAKEYSIKIIES